MESRFLQRGMVVNVFSCLCVVIRSETEGNEGIGADREGPLYVHTDELFQSEREYCPCQLPRM